MVRYVRRLHSQVVIISINCYIRRDSHTDTMSNMDTDDCVASWLWHIRQMTEMECTAILSAKSILPSKSDTSMDNSFHSTNKIQRSPKQCNIPQQVITESSAELFLGGKIPVGTREKMSVLRIRTSTPEVKSENASPCLSNVGIPLVPESYKMKQKSCGDVSMTSRAHMQKDSLLSTSSSSTDRCSGFSFPNPTITENNRIQYRDHDDSSLDSARGSSPIFSSSHDNSPVRASSPSTLRHDAVSAYRIGISFLPAYRDMKGMSILLLSRFFSLCLFLALSRALPESSCFNATVMLLDIVHAQEVTGVYPRSLSYWSREIWYSTKI